MVVKLIPTVFPAPGAAERRTVNVASEPRSTTWLGPVSETLGNCGMATAMQSLGSSVSRRNPGLGCFFERLPVLTPPFRRQMFIEVPLGESPGRSIEPPPHGGYGTRERVRKPQIGETARHSLYFEGYGLAPPCPCWRCLRTSARAGSAHVAVRKLGRTNHAAVRRETSGPACSHHGLGSGTTSEVS